jgi:hypothetical protein
MRMRSLGLSGSLGQSILLMHTLNWLAFDFSFKPLLFVYAAYMQTRKEGRKEGIMECNGTDRERQLEERGRRGSIGRTAAARMCGRLIMELKT